MGWLTPIIVPLLFLAVGYFIANGNLIEKLDKRALKKELEKQKS